MYVQRNNEARSHKHCCRGKAVLYILSACLQPLVIWHAKRMRRIVLPSVDCQAVPYCSTISHKRHDFGIKNLLNKTQVLLSRHFLLFQTDANNYKIIGILKQLKFRLSLRHVSVHAGTIIRELLRA